MTVSEMRYQNYRNITEAVLSFSDGVNILYGDNAQGKTNALEGIYCFALGKSFRGAKDRELLTFGAQAGVLDMRFSDTSREQTLSLRLFDGKTRQMAKNGVAIRRTADFVGAFHAVLFCPEHLSLIWGAPTLRRGFLDSAISQLRPAYLAYLTEYQRLLKQRNALLKDETQSVSARTPLLEVLTGQMAEVNARLTRTRASYVLRLNEAARAVISDMTGGGEDISLSYISDIYTGTDDVKTLSSAFYEKEMAYAAREFAAETTLHGCHRDDISVTLGGREARLYASQGQGRSLALAMKLGEGEIVRSVIGEYPVFLFDDVLSELDGSRQQYLLSRLDGRQVIFTSCNPELFAHCAGTHRILVEHGVYKG